MVQSVQKCLRLPFASLVVEKWSFRRQAIFPFLSPSCPFPLIPLSTRPSSLSLIEMTVVGNALL